MVAALSVTLKRQIYHHFTVLQSSPEAVLRALFMNDPRLCSVSHLRRLRALCNQRPTEALLWRESIPFFPGRPRLVPMDQGQQLIDLVTAMPNIRILRLTNLFGLFLFGDDAQLRQYSYSTVYRTLRRAGFTRKVGERHHIRRSDYLRVLYYERLQHYPAARLVDTDEMGSNPAAFNLRHGYAPRGRDAIFFQLVLGGHTYNTLATYGIGGFIYWKIFQDETINAAKFIAYMEELRLLLLPGAVGIFDNARIHKTDEALACIDDVFAGRYAFSAAYSPVDKPVELGFGNVKNYLRDNEADAVANPLLWINRAFELYSIRGERGHVALGHWNAYIRNHQFYLNN